MKIKRLEISGFKSFADKVVLDFQQGVTGIVGPNGCGKSNIVDAIRWCMGEQSVKSLRGKAMEDVIFIGSQDRKPLGLAEVSLVFSTEDGRAPAKYLEFSEIQLTRRLFRGGESEYMINKTPCRLMDISEMFMDTGVGTKAYSIIEQGKIAQILHSRPEERRLLIEEAAGVTKYKTRKQLALKKIDATRQNLLRLSDLIGEIKRQLNNLQRQAQKAEKFRLYREELREIDMLFTLNQANGLDSEIKQINQQMLELNQGIEEAVNVSVKSRNKVELCRTEMLEAEKTLNIQQEELFILKNEAVAVESSLTFCRKEHNVIHQRLVRFDIEIETLVTRKSSLYAELARLKQQLQKSAVELATAETGLLSLAEDHKGQELEFDELNRQFDSKRHQLFNVANEASNYRTRYAEAYKRLSLSAERLERLKRDKTQLYDLMEATRKRTLETERELNIKGLDFKALETELALLVEQELLLKAKLPELEKQVESCREQLSNSRSRLLSLQELEAKFAGYGQGVRLLMTDSSLREEFRGTLADGLMVSEDIEVAVDAALAEKVQTIICSNKQSLVASIDYLKQCSGGRARFVCPNKEDITTQQIIDGATPLLSLVELDDNALLAGNVMLANLYLTDSLEKALNLRNKHPELCFVTAAGEVVSPDGTISGGSADAAQSGIIQNKRQIRMLGLQVKSLGDELKSSESDRDDLRTELFDVAQEIQQARSSLHGLELIMAVLDKDMKQCRTEENRLDEQVRLLAFEKAALDEERTGLKQELAEVEDGQKKAELLLKQLEESSEVFKNLIEERRLALTTAREAVTSERIKVAKLREQTDANHRTVTSLASQVAEYEIRTESLTFEKKQAEVELIELDRRIEADEQKLNHLLDQQLQQNELMLVVRQQYTAFSAQLESFEFEEHQRREEFETARRQHNELSLRLSAIRLQYEHIEQCLQERHRLCLEDVRERFVNHQLDEFAARVRQTELERQVDELGEVNLMAIEEYTEMQQRYDFLFSQKTDLEESLNDLQQAINRINRTTRKRFFEAFTLINGKFQEVFPRLFCGGRAELKLTDEQDLLETGIEIIVQPPGKKLSNVMLLSGGEKALTAVALIFSIFLIKPTPFCLLDEVDAPLDDANIGRFNEMVREMSVVSQFIIITHNKTTMGVADTLYGITMEEPGTSRLVSVRLH